MLYLRVAMKNSTSFFIFLVLLNFNLARAQPPKSKKITYDFSCLDSETTNWLGDMEKELIATVGVPAKFSDEVDAGVGGKAAIEVGKRLHALAQSSQVIVVTHLPQVAAWADTHFVVKKSSDGSVVQSGVSKLGQSERVEEIARMLAGLEESSSAREHAAELLAMRG